jgi:hypothetical protein
LKQLILFDNIKRNERLNTQNESVEEKDLLSFIEEQLTLSPNLEKLIFKCKRVKKQVENITSDLNSNQREQLFHA